MRLIPDAKFEGIPCSYVGIGCAYEKIYGKPFDQPMFNDLKDDGWTTLDNMNRYIRNIFSIKKKAYYRRTERLKLSEFLFDNTEKCIICVLGHFLYADGHDYWSFFDNDDDNVVCVWYIKS